MVQQSWFPVIVCLLKVHDLYSWMSLSFEGEPQKSGGMCGSYLQLSSPKKEGRLSYQVTVLLVAIVIAALCGVRQLDLLTMHPN